VLALGKDPEVPESKQLVQILMGSLPELRLEDVEFDRAVAHLVDLGGTSAYVSYEGAGVKRTTKVTIVAKDLTLAEAWCRLLAHPGCRLTLGLGERIYLLPVDALEVGETPNGAYQ
jgi:hypothetical protein